jgi:hypothetical protein
MTKGSSEGLVILSHPYAIDRPVASHPPGFTGYAPNNCYLLVEETAALLIDTGYTVDEVEILAEIDRVVGQRSFALFMLRLGEYASTCNARPIADRYSLSDAYAANDAHPLGWTDYRPEYQPSAAQGGAPGFRDVSQHQSRPGEWIRIGSEGRAVEVLNAPLRLLSTRWLYDSKTATLFTSDAFSWVWQPTVEGPWRVTGDEDPVSPLDMERQFLGNRFWWIAEADTERIQAEIDTIFDDREIRRIAPAYGCVLEGTSVVQRHRELLRRMLDPATRVTMNLAQGG